MDNRLKAKTTNLCISVYRKPGYLGSYTFYSVLIICSRHSDVRHLEHLVKQSVPSIRQNVPSAAVSILEPSIKCVAGFTLELVYSLIKPVPTFPT